MSNIKESDGRGARFFQWLSVIIFCTALTLLGVNLTGCSHIERAFDENGDLTPYGQAYYDKGAAIVETVTDYAPAPYAGIIGGVCGGVALLAMGAGKIYRIFKPKEAI